jgi:hypothetical protein
LYARHEFTLNHRFSDGKLLTENLLPFPWLVYVINRFFRRFFKAKKLVAKKRTAAGFRELVEKKDEVKGLMIEARAWVDELAQDYAEANVYLERFIPMVKEVFPEAVLIHLHRDPRNVIRSILNRNWYNTPADSKHPVMKKEGWDSLTQFEKACWYIRKTNETLVSACSRRLAFEKMVSDLDYLAEQLRSLNIPVFPRLALKEFNKRINENRSYEFLDYAEWPVRDKQAFHSICHPINEILGYETSGDIPNEPLESAYPEKMPLERGLNEVSPNKVIFETDFRNASKFYSIRGCAIKNSEDGIEVFPHGNKLSYLLIGGGKWHYLKGNEGWLSKIGHYYQCVLDAEVSQEIQVIPVCLMYNGKGNLVVRRTLGQIKNKLKSFKFLFKVRGDTKRFNIAVCFPASGLQGSLKIKKIRIEEMALQNT